MVVVKTIHTLDNNKILFSLNCRSEVEAGYWYLMCNCAGNA